MNIEEAAERYFTFLSAEKGLAVQTLSSYREDFVIFTRLFPNIQDTADLYESLPGDFGIKLGDEQRAASTIARRVSFLYNFLLFLSENGWIDFAVEKIDRPKLPSHLPSVLSFEEIEALLDAPETENESGMRDKAMLETMYATDNMNTFILKVSHLIELLKVTVLFQ